VHGFFGEVENEKALLTMLFDEYGEKTFHHISRKLKTTVPLPKINLAMSTAYFLEGVFGNGEAFAQKIKQLGVEDGPSFFAQRMKIYKQFIKNEYTYTKNEYIKTMRTQGEKIQGVSRHQNPTHLGINLHSKQTHSVSMCLPGASIEPHGSASQTIVHHWRVITIVGRTLASKHQERICLEP